MAGTECVSPVRQELSSYKGFTLDFTQTDKYPFLDESRQASGKLMVSLPDKFIWTSKEEDAPSSTISSDGKTVWFYQPSDDPRDKAQVYINSSDESVNIPSILLSCPGDNLISVISKGRKRTLYVSGNGNKNYKWAKISYLVKPFNISELTFESPSGATTTIRSKNFKPSTKPTPDSTFKFKVPPGTKVIQ